jgi:hypothetical protein
MRRDAEINCQVPYGRKTKATCVSGNETHCCIPASGIFTQIIVLLGKVPVDEESASLVNHDVTSADVAMKIPSHFVSHLMC